MAETVTGSGYRLTFALQPPLLSVRLEGEHEVLPGALLAVTGEYWHHIAARVRESGATQLLVVDALPNAVMPDADLARFFDGIAGLGLERARIAYVEGRVDQSARIEFVELLALERGYRVRMFGDEGQARLWLRYGED